jgi:aspartate/methionine/tyrosine aminotransferase
MTQIRSGAGSRYMQWAKLSSTAKYNLATSGMMNLPLSALGVTLEQLEINGPTIYGYAPLMKAVAARYTVPQESVVSAMGTSFANYLALAAATEPGDEVLIEQPTYDPILGAARYLGLAIKRFHRKAENHFALDIAEVERNFTSRTRVIVLCNLHNPSGASTSNSVLSELARLAGKNRGYVMVDEVYREMLFAAEPQTAFHIDSERFIVTSSLTKAYGLSGLRCGWILAPQALAERIWHIHDVHAATYPFMTEYLSVRAFEKLLDIASAMKSLLDENRSMLQSFLASRDDLEFFWPEYGAIVFPRLKHGNLTELSSLLRSEFDTSIVPGEFFEMPDHFRIGVGLPSQDVRAALEQLHRGLDRYKASLLSRV